MTTQILSRPQGLLIPPSIRKDGNILLEALRRIETGRIILITPEGKRLEFAGRNKGPVAYLRLYDWGVVDDLAAHGEIGFAQAYIDKRWETSDLPILLTLVLMNGDAFEGLHYGKPMYALWIYLKNIFRLNSLSGSRRNIMAHYDLGNDFYRLWLDDSMTYSCALFEGDTHRTLEAAQQAKYQRILRKISAAPGDRVLDIGCGWGGFAIAAARAGLHVTGITLSGEQAEYAREQIRRFKLEPHARIELKDYRKLEGSFDHIVSIGMFEHVGENYWPVYFRSIKEHLKAGGRALVQCITMEEHLFHTLHNKYGFIEEYVFPGGALASKSHFKAAAEREGLMCREMFEFGADYAITLEHWLTRFEAQKESMLAMGYNDAFLRLWRFYLSSCIAAFASRRTDVVQAELVHAPQQ